MVVIFLDLIWKFLASILDQSIGTHRNLTFIGYTFVTVKLLKTIIVRLNLDTEDGTRQFEFEIE